MFHPTLDWRVWWYASRWSSRNLSRISSREPAFELDHFLGPPNPIKTSTPDPRFVVEGPKWAHWNLPTKSIQILTSNEKFFLQTPWMTLTKKICINFWKQKSIHFFCFAFHYSSFIDHWKLDERKLAPAMPDYTHQILDFQDYCGPLVAFSWFIGGIYVMCFFIHHCCGVKVSHFFSQ